MEYGCIYMIMCMPTKKVYIGQTVNWIKRKNDHFSSLNANRHRNSHLQNSFNKYGENKFITFILQDFVPKNKLDDCEIIWIKKFNSKENGFNQKSGGNRITDHHYKKCKWNGKIYNSRKEMANCLGLTSGGVYYRLSKGYSCDNDMIGSGNYNNTNRKHKQCIWNGKSYNSISMAALENNIPYNTMKNRIRNGYICDNDMKGSGYTAHNGLNNISKLTVNDVYEILHKRYNLNIPLKDIANNYSVSISNISCITRGKTWKHIFNNYFK